MHQSSVEVITLAKIKHHLEEGNNEDHKHCLNQTDLKVMTSTANRRKTTALEQNQDANSKDKVQTEDKPQIYLIWNLINIVRSYNNQRH